MDAPDFLLAGGHKCATTTLYALLDSHPGIAMAAVKEPHFLARAALQHRLHTGVWSEGEYERLWAGAEPGRLRGEASVLYLSFADEVVRELDERPHGARKVVLSLRNPVDRAFSSYSDERLKNPHETAETFEEAVAREMRRGPRTLAGVNSPALNHLALGFYADGVETYQRALGKENVHVLLFEDLRQDPATTWLAVQRFLGLSDAPNVATAEQQNVGGVRWSSGVATRLARSRAAVFARRRLRRVSPSLHARLRSLAMRRLTAPVEPMRHSTRVELAELYSDDVANLSALLDRDLHEWAYPHAER